jgi:hypothetical protein
MDVKTFIAEVEEIVRARSERLRRAALRRL